MAAILRAGVAERRSTDAAPPKNLFVDEAVGATLLRTHEPVIGGH
jgi:hypothetical protein